MSLAPGTRLGAYEIAARIGAGGMGEVYRATDTKLKRQVALKSLPDSFATDSDRLARFQREAEVLASLNHPNIAAIYGFEDMGGAKALVMELVEGPTQPWVRLGVLQSSLQILTQGLLDEGYLDLQEAALAH
jgi:serine/threonine protein kinase